MTFNDEQFEALAQYEESFLTITRSNYARPVGYQNAKRIRDIANAAGMKTGWVNFSCARCISRLLRQVGTAWLADKAERIAQANDAEAAKLTAEAAETAQISAPKTKAGKSSTKTSKPKKTAEK